MEKTHKGNPHDEGEEQADEKRRPEQPNLSAESGVIGRPDRMPSLAIGVDQDGSGEIATKKSTDTKPYRNDANSRLEGVFQLFYGAFSNGFHRLGFRMQVDIWEW